MINLNTHQTEFPNNPNPFLINHPHYHCKKKKRINRGPRGGGDEVPGKLQQRNAENGRTSQIDNK